MKTLLCGLGILAVALSHAAGPEDPQMRTDIEQDVPLVEAIRRTNEQYPDVQPLTAQEVIAAVKAIELEHPDIPGEVRRIYARVVQEQVLPRGMYFSRVPVMTTATDYLDVDWKDLTLTALPAGTKDPKIGYGFNYRIRTRFVSSRPLTEAESKQQRQLLERVEPSGPANGSQPSRPDSNRSSAAAGSRR